MSGPMGVPTQRLSNKPKNSTTPRPSPMPIAGSKMRTSKTKLHSRTQSDTTSESVTVKSLEITEMSLSKALSQKASGKDRAGKDSGGPADKGSRKIATNSRIKKNEQTKRDMYLAFVNNALKAKSEGNPTPYNELVSQFSTTSEQVDYNQLRTWLVALSHVVSQLDKRHIALIEAIVNMPWTTSSDENFVKGYMGFVGMLVSARTEWLNLVVASGVRRLTHRSPLNTPPSAQSSSLPPITLRTIFSRAHALLQTLLDLFPTLPQTLPTHLLRYFPHKSHNTTSHTVYCQNLVEVMGYCPQIVEPVLGLMVERAIGIDVEIQVELEELEELIASNNESSTAVDSGLLSNLDPFDTPADEESSSDGDSDADEGGDVENFSDVSSEAEGDDEEEVDALNNGKTNEKEASRRAKRLREMVAKLDSVMGLLLKWLKNTSSADENGQHAHFVAMMGIFDRTILTTFKSRYTQFLIFYLVSLPSYATSIASGDKTESLQTSSPSTLPNPHADVFLGLLLHNTLIPQDPPIPMLTRIASASYLASFISRALCVGSEECRSTVSVCCQWIAEHLSDLEILVNGRSGDDAQLAEDVPEGNGYTELGVLYAVSQALFLIFCFRWRDLLENGEQDEDEEAEEGKRRWIRPMDIIQRLVVSSLNPLKICSPNVVNQFARVSQKVGFVYCQSIIESNRRAAPSTISTSTTPITPGTATPSLHGLSLYTPTSHTPSLHGTGANPWDTVQSSAIMKDLQAFFPFDPYRLPESRKWFEGMYREWGMVAIDDDEDDDDEEEDEQEEEDVEQTDAVDSDADSDGALDVSQTLQQESSDEEEEEYGVPMELGSVREGRGNWDGLGMSESFGKMSISPVPGGIHRQMKKKRA